MAAGDTREPTLTEIKDEVIKQAQHSRISMWLTVAGFGVTIAIFGGSICSSGIYSSGIPIFAIGLGIMIWASSMAKKRQQEFKTKWNEPPRF